MPNKWIFNAIFRFFYKLSNADCNIEVEKREAEIIINVNATRTPHHRDLIDNYEFFTILPEILREYNIYIPIDDDDEMIIRIHIENMGFDDAGELQESLEFCGFKTFIHQEWEWVNA